MSHFGTCRGRPAAVTACDLQCRRPRQGLQISYTAIFRSSGEGPASRTALAPDVSHSREPARAFGSEDGLDADALTVYSSLHSAYYWAGKAPDVLSCVRQSPTNAGHAIAHPMPSLHTPPPHQPRS